MLGSSRYTLCQIYPEFYFTTDQLDEYKFSTNHSTFTYTALQYKSIITFSNNYTTNPIDNRTNRILIYAKIWSLYKRVCRFFTPVRGVVKANGEKSDQSLKFSNNMLGNLKVYSCMWKSKKKYPNLENFKRHVKQIPLCHCRWWWLHHLIWYSVLCIICIWLKLSVLVQSFTKNSHDAASKHYGGY